MKKEAYESKQKNTQNRFEQLKTQCYFGNRCKYIMLSLIGICLFLIAFLIIPKISLFSIQDYDSNFNLDVEILDKYLEVFPGEEIWFSITIMNLGVENRQDIILESKIITLKDHEEIISKTETVAVETSNSFVRKLEIPKDTIPGDYIVSLKATYANGTVGIAEHTFRILEVEKKFNWTLVAYIVIIVIVLLILFRLIMIVLKLKKRVEQLSPIPSKKPEK